MANEEYVAVLKQGQGVWNRWRKEHRGVHPDLSGAVLRGMGLFAVNLREAVLHGADLREAVLFAADLREASLSKVDFRGTHITRANLGKAVLLNADLSGAVLHEANLSGAILSGAKLRGAMLTGADLREASLSGADLSGASLYKSVLGRTNLDEAIMNETLLTDLNLSQVKGLETVRHGGPSDIGFQTIYLSQGQIPEAFLRGAGVPNRFIEILRELVAAGSVHYYTCFISYAREDREFVEKLRNDLLAHDVHCWIDREDIRGGEDFLDSIFDAIDKMDKFLVVLSKNSIAKPWVKREVARARERADREDKDIIIPLTIDDEYLQTKIHWVKDVLSKQTENFANWYDQDAYQKAFTRLLRDLKSDAAPPKLVSEGKSAS